MSTQEKNKEIVAKYFAEYWGKRNPNIVDELCADDFMISYPMHGPKHGKEAAKQMLLDFKKAFPDVSSESQSHGEYLLIADGEIVAGRWVGGGTHTGSSFDDLVVGEGECGSVGKRMRFSGISIFTLRDGKILREVGDYQVQVRAGST